MDLGVLDSLTWLLPQLQYYNNYLHNNTALQFSQTGSPTKILKSAGQICDSYHSILQPRICQTVLIYNFFKLLDTINILYLDIKILDKLCLYILLIT